MKSIAPCLFPAMLAVFLSAGPLHSEEFIWDNDFTRGLRGWRLGGNAVLKREADKLYVRLTGPEGGGVSPCISPLIELDGEEHKYELTCVYRTGIEASALHSGAWFIFFKRDENQEVAADWTGLILPPSETWNTVKKTVSIPRGIRTFQTAFRVQGRPGKTLDVRTVRLKEVTP